MNNIVKVFESGDKVKIIKEKRTSGLLGAVVPVEDSTNEYVDVTILGQTVRLDMDEVELVERCPKLEKVLYHGTDAKFISLPLELRQSYHKGCSLIINTLFEKYYPYFSIANDSKLKN